MNIKTRLIINAVVNALLLFLIITMTYSWMLTQKSEAEILNYDRDIVITDSDIEVDVYALVGNSYVEQTTSPISLGLLEPGITYKYRFDITNNNAVKAVIKILYNDLTGDVTDLDDFIVLGSTSPESFAHLMSDYVSYNADEDRYYATFLSRVEIPANSTLSIYAYIGMTEDATSLISGKELSIANIMFMKP